MKLREALKAPQLLKTSTQNAVVISCIALIVAGIALIMVAHKGGN